MPPEVRDDVTDDDMAVGEPYSAAAEASWAKASTATSIKSLSIALSPLSVISLTISSIVEFEIDSRRFCLLVGAATTPITKVAVVVNPTRCILEIQERVKCIVESWPGD